jgi:NAD(P)-dependent dehydrogenase (short-subunit alcohol dehydrogenase family)
LTRSAALDYAKDGITVTAVAPAVIRTPIVDAAIASGEFFDEKTLIDYHPVGRLGEVSDVAKAVSFLLDSPFVTGSVVEVDGGAGAA